VFIRIRRQYTSQSESLRRVDRNCPITLCCRRSCFLRFAASLYSLPLSSRTKYFNVRINRFISETGIVPVEQQMAELNLTDADIGHSDAHID
jgi:hypothetical protein